MATNSTSEDMREARGITRDLYNAAHIMACNDPHCPWARLGLSNESSASTNAGASPEEEAVLILLFGIAENVGECLDLLRTLVADMDETSSLSHLSPSSTNTSRSSTEDTYFEHHQYVGSPPRPGLYRDQWTQTPALSPPAYTAFLHDYHRSYPHAPAVSPASSEMTTPDFEPPIIEDQEEVSRDGHGERDRAINLTGPSPSRHGNL
ncbi:hypothetical protein KVR01_010165 [Diaporthe batatas]|uniref:uncharacterized protein n=1 Tax=Diaporthe batatas TaxID=748121 RepID=UPI001D046338|nr:uncharacterized protein KVR01_010165 [Diaporthe batatas]KAG8159528.1 hypothetical protein KVR01_010165 [Diaporthe batatas]